MKKPFTLKILLVLALLLSVAKLNAQVHIGADVAPKPFSVLELYAKYKTDPIDTYGGLRMPQLDTVQRNALSRTYGSDPAFFGLTIYNTTNNCLEYWNATKWVSLCLGIADITLIGDNCTYEPGTPIPDDAEPCTYTPEEFPECNISNPFQIYLVSGFHFATVQIVDEFTSAFTVIFEENNTIYNRTAIVRVTSNCTGEFKDFPFIQPGADCPGGGAFLVDKNTDVLCDNIGGVIAWVTNPESGINYIWALNGGVVHTGNYMQITRPGRYTVYPGLLGCEPSQFFDISLNPGGPSPTPPTVTVNNYGMLCPSNSVTLTARNVDYPVQWFQNEKLYDGVYSDGTAGPPSANPLVVSGASAAGQWFAVQIDDPCGSRMSNIVFLIDATTNGSPLPQPVFRINGTLYNDTPPPVICIDGTLELEIVNHAAFPSGTIYEWFANGRSIHPPTTSPLIYTNPQSTGTVIIYVQANNSSGDCPNTSETAALNVIHLAPPMPIINNGAATAPICGGDPVDLEVTDPAGITYEWFRNENCSFITGVQYEKMPPNTPLYQATDPGYCYAVRYIDVNGCWSSLSPAIRVFSSSVINLKWDIKSKNPANVGDQESVSVRATPDPDSYQWISLNGKSIIRPDPTNGKDASIEYTAAGTEIILVTAKNACGPVSVRDTITIYNDCVQVTAVTISPAGNISRNPGTTTRFTATVSPNAATPDITYTWYVNGTALPSGPAGSSSGTGAAYRIYDYTAPPAGPATDTVYVVASNCETPPPPAIVTSPITIITIPRICTDVTSTGNYITGPTCYDVNMTDWGNSNSCMSTGTRSNSFRNAANTADQYNFSYTLIVPNPYTVLEWSVVDPSQVLSTTNPITWINNVATITFRSDIRTWAQGTTRSNPMRLTIVAKYCPTTPSTCPPTACREVRLVVNVQDCSCGCVARKSASEYMALMCYNLGAAAAVQNLTPTAQQAYPTPASNYGDLYQWGRTTDGHEKRTSANFPCDNFSSPNVGSQGLAYTPIGSANLNANGQPTGTVTIPAGGGATAPVCPGTWNVTNRFIKNAGATSDWRTPQSGTLWNSKPNDPCPSGWRLLTSTEINALTNTSLNTTTWNGSNTPGRLITPTAGGFSAPSIFLPAAGHRNHDTGDIVGAGSAGRYWSSTPTTSGTKAVGYGIEFTSSAMGTGVTGWNRGRGFSIRCVHE